MKKTLFVLALAAVAMAGCIGGPGEEQINATELKQMMVDSVKVLETYRFTMDVEQKMDFINHSSNETNASRVEISSRGEGTVNLPARELMVSTTNTVVPVDDPTTPSQTEESKTFIINDTMYMLIQGNWTKLSIPNADLIWSQQNMVQNQVAMMNSSQVKLLGSEKVDGADCYMIEVVPEMSTFSSILSEQLGSSMPVAFMNMSKLFDQSELSWTAWVTKEDHFVKKSDLTMVMTLTPDILGLSADVVGDFEMNIETKATISYADFNKDVLVTLPEEALGASPLPLYPMGMPTAEGLA
ncbi:MAG: hypothetical protein JW986_10115 [Methanotrichaceae archaeon]|nr:hypothetical protein [Methanotrichaceae archaeon]